MPQAQEHSQVFIFQLHQNQNFQNSYSICPKNSIFAKNSNVLKLLILFFYYYYIYMAAGGILSTKQIQKHNTEQ